MKKFDCPSSPPMPNSKLLGVFNEETNRMEILPEPVPVDEDIRKELERFGDKTMKTVRLTNTCATKACGQWDGHKCTLIGGILEKIEEKKREKGLQDCSIRPTCRWYAQEKEEACKVCTLVQYDQAS
ncbi:hypothetical protein [Zobellia russellii]|uniref:hypothetical protein n=1 Tax=Zobellia russellii TaxID=248907 RepID=UPI0037DCC0E0